MGSKQRASMELTCKDIRDNKRITVRLGTEDRVGDLINIISRELGEENSYRLVCCGKIMCEFEKISSYKTFSVLPIIVMVTTPEQHSRYSEQIREVEDCFASASMAENPRLCYDSGFDSE